MRKLASIQRISDIKAIPEADNIVAYKVNGWWVVDRKGAYDIGDLVIYCEIDSWIPHARAPFLSKGKTPSVFIGIDGERLKTIRLKGQISQGLLLPMHNLTNYGADLDIGADVSEKLGIVKYEPPVPMAMAGLTKGNFPSFIPKTDQERIQNLQPLLDVWKTNDMTWEVTEKLDGSSMTVFCFQQEIGVCSRNLELKEDYDNAFWYVAKKDGLIDKLKSVCAEFNIALQGELIGESVQKNRYKKAGRMFRLFDIYSIDGGEYFTPEERVEFSKQFKIAHVPVIDSSFVLNETTTIDTLLSMAEGKSKENLLAEREGLVFKSNSPAGPTFKAISNKFLMNGGE